MGGHVNFNKAKGIFVVFIGSAIGLALFQNATFYGSRSYLPSISQFPDCAASVNNEGKRYYRCTAVREYPSGIPGRPNLKWDLYLPPAFAFANGAQLPLSIVIHGGGWNGDKITESGFSQNLAARGYVVANINYTIASEQPWDPFKNATMDIQSFVKLAFDPGIAQYYKINTAKTSLVGFSAGGHLALMEATRGQFQYWGVFTGSAPTRIDQMTRNPDPNFSNVLDDVFGSSQSFRAAMSPYNRVGQLKTQYLYMEHSQTDTLVPFQHGLDFYFAANVVKKVGTPAAGDPIQMSPAGYPIGSHNFSSGSLLQQNMETLINTGSL